MFRRIRSLCSVRCLLLLGILTVVCIGTVHAQKDLLGGLANENIQIGYDQTSLEEFAHVAERGIKIIMLLMRPLLTIAGASMDNSLVYGGAFHLTTALWKFRQIIRTFTNFTLGFLFVGTIIAAFFGFKKEEGTTRVWKLLTKTLLAGILINMSRRVLAALIDLSTITTVAIGGLPLHILNNDNPATGDKIRTEDIFYMRPYVNMNLAPSQDSTQDKNNYSTVWGCTTKPPVQVTTYYLPCPVNDDQLLKKIAPVTDPLSRQNYKQNFVDARSLATPAQVNEASISNDFCVYNLQLIAYDESKHLSQCQDLSAMIKAGKDEGMAVCAKIDELITRATGMTGPLFTLFGSLLGVSSIPVVGNYGSVAEVTLEALIKMAFGLALIIPLFAFAIVMIIRVVIIWVLIVFAPILVLAFVFGFGEKLKDINAGMTISNIMSLLFLPTFAVFGVSISIVFLSLLVNLPKIEEKEGLSEAAITQPDGCANDVTTAITKGERNSNEQTTCYDFKVTTICINESTRRTGANIVMMMNRLVINSFGIAMMRMIVFFVLKSNDFTKGVAEGIETTAKKRMETIPIIPIGGGVGLGAVTQLPGKVGSEAVNRINEQYQQFDLEDRAKNRAMNNDPEKKALEQKFTNAKGNIAASTAVANEHGILSPGIPEYTDMEDYQNAPRVYANDRGIGDQDVGSWEKALGNEKFVDEMIKKGAYNKTEFLDQRDKSRVSDTELKHARMMEDQLQSLVRNTNGFSGRDVLTTKKGDIKKYNRYLYKDNLIKYSRGRDEAGKRDKLISIETTPLSLNKTSLQEMSVEEVNSLGRLVDNLKRDGIPDQIALKANFRKRIIEADTSPEEQNGQRVRAASLKNGTVTVGFNDQLGSSILSISTEAKAEETKPKE